MIDVRSLNPRRRFARVWLSCAGAAQGAVGVLSVRTATEVRGKRRRLGTRGYVCRDGNAAMVLALRLYRKPLRLIRGARLLRVDAAFATADEEGHPVTGRSTELLRLR